MPLTELLIDLLLLLLPAAWLAVALLENLRHPTVNARQVAETLAMEPVREDPDIWAAVQGNRIQSPTLHRWAFRLVVAWEALVLLALLGAALWFCLLALGLAAPAGARALSLAAVGGFTLLWGLLLAGGQWVYIWVGSPQLQTTHFLLLLWGVATLAVLR